MKANSKKFRISLVAIAASAALVIGSAFAATSNLSGYTRFKEVLFNTAESESTVYQNVTTTVKMKIAKDGTEVVSGESISQSGKNASYSKSTITTGSDTETIESWFEDSDDSWQHVSKNSNEEKYYVDMTSKSHGFADEDGDYDDEHYAVVSSTSSGMTSAQTRFANAVIDTLMGDTKNYFSTSGNQISVHLEGAQIPELANLAIAAMEESMREDIINNRSNSNESHTLDRIYKTELLSLKDFTVSSLDAIMTLEKDFPVSAEFEMSFNAVDTQGGTHKIDFIGELSNTDIGTTVVNKFDLEKNKDNCIIEKNNSYTVIESGPLNTTVVTEAAK